MTVGSRVNDAAKSAYSFLTQSTNSRIGKVAEKVAKRKLKSMGYEVLGSVQNRSNHGIDIVARNKAGKLRFFEVKGHR